MNSNIDIEIGKTSVTRGIKFDAFIAVNRYLDKDILRDSEFFTLLMYIALKVNRSSEPKIVGSDGIKLETGQFLIGRLRTKNDIGISDSKYRTRIKKLVDQKIIKHVKTPSNYSIYEWLENSFVDVNLEIPFIQQNNQQTSSRLTTNNNINNTNKYMPLISTIFRNIDNSIKDNYLRVLVGYMEYKEIELKGEEIKKALYVIKQMFDSDRKTEQIIGLMQWFKKYENNKEYPWVRSWTLNTVQNKLPEFLAGKLKIVSTEDEFPRYQHNRGRM